jgi:hypothetical protein
MDPSAQFLLGHDVPESSGATIHALPSPEPVVTDDDKIGFTLDVAARLKDERANQETHGAEIVPITDEAAQDLADTA